MDLVLLSLAFSAGLFTFFSPCTIAVFPMYLAYLLRLKGNNTLILSVIASLLVSMGASLVFLVLGFSSSIVVMMLLSNYGFIKIALGLILITLGLTTLSSREFVFSVPIPSMGFAGGFYLTSLLYGVVYAFASLSCSLPVFLMIVFASASSGGLFGLFLSFLAFSFGLIIPMCVLSFLTVYSRSLVEKAYRSTIPYIKRLSGFLLIVAGFYLMFFS